MFRATSVISMSSFIFLTLNVQAHISALEDFKTKPVLASLQDLKMLRIPILAQDEVSQVGYAMITPLMQQRLQAQSHFQGKCAGFEVLDEKETKDISVTLKSLSQLRSLVLRDQEIQFGPLKTLEISKNEDIAFAVSLVQENNLKETVNWLSSFKNRYEKASTANDHVMQMKTKLEEMLRPLKMTPWTVDLISHQSTGQKSIRVSIRGATKPDEIVVLGGHLDSINQSGWGSAGEVAPGADDNASGSANILETMRVFIEQNQAQRTVEFFWYAGEESGLLGSAEIAKSYKEQKKNVVAVMQLDMTLFPGTGEMTISSMTDFTTPWLRETMAQLNNQYVGLKIFEDQCGYGCSDHASWYRQGFPTVIPFEAKMNDMNKNIHTTKDIVTPQLSFKHSAAITRLALAYVLEVSNPVK